MGIESVTQLDPARWAGAVAELGTSDAALRQVLHGLPGVDQVGTEARTAGLATRSIKREAKMQALDMAVRMVDLTTLEGADTPGKVRALCAKALRPDPAVRASVPTWSTPGSPCSTCRSAASEVPSSATAPAHRAGSS